MNEIIVEKEVKIDDILIEKGDKIQVIEAYDHFVQHYFNGDFEEAYNQATSFLYENDLLNTFQRQIKNGERY